MLRNILVFLLFVVIINSSKRDKGEIDDNMRDDNSREDNLRE